MATVIEEYLWDVRNDREPPPEVRAAYERWIDELGSSPRVRLPRLNQLREPGDVTPLRDASIPTTRSQASISISEPSVEIDGSEITGTAKIVVARSREAGCDTNIRRSSTGRHTAVVGINIDVRTWFIAGWRDGKFWYAYTNGLKKLGYRELVKLLKGL